MIEVEYLYKKRDVELQTNFEDWEAFYIFIKKQWNYTRRNFSATASRVDRNTYQFTSFSVGMLLKLTGRDVTHGP